MARNSLILGLVLAGGVVIAAGLEAIGRPYGLVTRGITLLVLALVYGYLTHPPRRF